MAEHSAETEFYKELVSLQVEYDEARAVRKDDPERWEAAQVALRNFRQDMRTLSGRGMAGVATGVGAAVAADVVEG